MNPIETFLQMSAVEQLGSIVGTMFFIALTSFIIQKIDDREAYYTFKKFHGYYPREPWWK